MTTYLTGTLHVNFPLPLISRLPSRTVFRFLRKICAMAPALPIGNHITDVNNTLPPFYYTAPRRCLLVAERQKARMTVRQKDGETGRKEERKKGRQENRKTKTEKERKRKKEK